MKKVIIFTIIAIAIIFVIAMANESPEIIGYDSYVALSGDTLWDIAELSNGYGNMDIREIIFDIQEASGLNTADIHSGDILQIPVYDLK